MKIQVFFLLLIPIISILSIQTMEQENIPTPIQQTMRIHEKVIMHNMLVPVGIYTKTSLEEWIKQERLNNAFWLAVAQNAPIKTIATLIAAGADSNHIYNNIGYKANGEAPLHMAAKKHNVALVTALLQLGANADQKDTAGNSPLDWAIMFRKFNRRYYNNTQIAKQYQKIIRLLTMRGAHDQHQKHSSIFLN